MRQFECNAVQYNTQSGHLSRHYIYRERKRGGIKKKWSGSLPFIFSSVAQLTVGLAGLLGPIMVKPDQRV